MLDFKDWFISEGKDIFGFDKDKVIFDKPQNDNQPPVHNLNLEYVTKLLLRRYLGIRPIKQLDFCTLQLGEDAGAIKLTFSPFGSIKATIRRMIYDLMGESKWICKKVNLINIEDSTGKEENVAENLFEKINSLDNQLLESPKSEYDLENFVLHLTTKVKINSPKWFIYEGLRQLNDNNYLIHFSCRGQGNGKLKDPRRLIEFIIDVSYNRKSGLIKVMGSNVDTSMKGHHWELDNADFNEYFTPSQPMNEIIEAVVNLFKVY